jgi:hypothetical protein
MRGAFVEILRLRLRMTQPKELSLHNDIGLFLAGGICHGGREAGGRLQFCQYRKQSVLRRNIFICKQLGFCFGWAGAMAHNLQG